MGPTLKNPPAGAPRARISLPRPMVDFNTPDKELFSIAEKMVTLARQEKQDAEGRGDKRRTELLGTALDFSAEKMQKVTSGAVTGSDVGGELRQALNVLINTIYQ
ncbi:MAG: hypothetical protein AB1324_06995 [Candidatus Micrarchaeota archaeon]